MMPPRSTGGLEGNDYQKRCQQQPDDEPDHASQTGPDPFHRRTVRSETTCEYDSVRAAKETSAEAHVLILKNLISWSIRQSIDRYAAMLRSASILFIPVSFSRGDEPNGSGKFITAFLHREAVKDGIVDLLGRHGGLIYRICNRFHALIKLEPVPYGKLWILMSPCQP